MKKVQILVFSVPLLLCFCKQKPVSTSVAMAFYDSINNQINITRPLQQIFLDKTAYAIMNIKQDKTAKIDTAELNRYLDSAKRMNAIRLSKIKNIDEIDKDLNYKQKVESHAKLLDNYYNNEFTNCIKFLGNTDENRFQKCSTLMMPALAVIKKDLERIEQTKTAFKAKYGFNSTKRVNQAAHNISFQQYGLLKMFSAHYLYSSTGKEARQQFFKYPYC